MRHMAKEQPWELRWNVHTIQRDNVHTLKRYNVLFGNLHDHYIKA